MNVTSHRNNAMQLVRAALVGHGISQSRTPAMHMAEGKAQNLNYQYDIFDVSMPPYKSLSLAQIINFAETEGYLGLNVTHPFKIEALSLVDELAPAAELIGAVNTIVFDDGRRIGHNTDYSGFSTAFHNQMADASKDHVLLLGSGGAGNAVALALMDNGVETLSVYDIAQDQAILMAERLSVARPDKKIRIIHNLRDLDAGEIDGVVNATPMGMDKYPGTAIKVENLSSETWVADIVYFPLETELLKQAKQHGCRVMSGAGMAICQAVDAFALITGLEPDMERFSRFFSQLPSDIHPEYQAHGPFRSL